MKKMIVQTKDTMDLIKNEIQIWKQITGHPNVIQFVDAQQV